MSNAFQRITGKQQTIDTFAFEITKKQLI